MKSLILIPSYLWKNTLRRWFEYPISPISKLLVPILLSLLATLILVFFNEVETQLQNSLKDSDSLSVYVTEQVVSSNNSLISAQSFEEEAMLQQKYGQDKITFIRQPFVSVKWRGNLQIPIIVYSDNDPELAEISQTTLAPTIWFLTSSPDSYGSHQVVNIGKTQVVTIPKKLPKLIQDNIETTEVIAVPREMAAPIMGNGFVVHMLANLSSLEEAQSFQRDVKAYYKAENRRIRVFSALEILENIEKINALQNYLRIGIVFSCGIILALILGTIAWLEYRQEAYLAALLRSFGTPRILLVWHAFLENLVLVLGGIGITFVIWKPIYSQLQQRITTMDLSPANSLALSPTDSYTIFIAGIAGVLVAMLPLIFALRKPPGLILQ